MMKNKGFRGGRRIVACLLAVVILAPATIFAITTGDTVTYTMKEESDGDHVFGIKGTDYTGTCAQMGQPAGNGGEARVTIIGKNHAKYQITQLAYYYGVKQKWHGNDGYYTPSTTNTGYKKKDLLKYMIQITNQGPANWKNICVNGNYLSANSCDAIIEWMDSLNIDDIDVPSSFECMFLYPAESSKQTMVVWGDKGEGGVKLRKTSGIIQITG